MASGSSTSCIQRGSTTVGTLAGGGTVGSGSCAIGTSMRLGAIASRRPWRRTPRSSSSATSSAAPAGARWRRCCPCCASSHAPDFVVVNGENAAGGIGITPKEADELFELGADVITLGNHTYRHREVWPYLQEKRTILRPYNYLPTQPGRGTCVVERGGTSLGVVNLSGNLFMQAGSPALVAVDDALREVSEADHVLVDMHAEATSEKVALGWYLDGRVTAVVGTHTHVPTADARVLPGRDRLHHRRRHDRRPRRRDRRQARAVDRGHAHAHADALRRGRGGPVDQRGADPLLAAAAGGRDRAGPAAGAGVSSAIHTSGANHTR